METPPAAGSPQHRTEQAVTVGVVALFAAAILLLLMLPGCKHEPPIAPLVEDGGNGGGGGDDCDPNVVYFQQQVLPLLISNCAVPGCHDQATDDNDWIQITDYNTLLNSGIIQDGDLVEALNEDDPDKIMPPPDQPGLTDQQIDLIELWIAQGAQNNSCSSGCDTTNVTYSGTIVPLVQQRCGGCHGGANPQGGLNLGTHAVLSTLALDGTLAASVTHAPQAIPMPPSGPMLPQCDIDKFLIWIQDGAPNN
ncbi:MAG TPA: hypothetical protein PLH93_07920 [Flavobacteriales bacterium]|nr:hypothetical protein [Flavobacteriales bacterium]HQW87096.1 hypothetical protein [Flavobacteriales bacterium]